VELPIPDDVGTPEASSEPIVLELPNRKPELVKVGKEQDGQNEELSGIEDKLYRPLQQASSESPEPDTQPY
jgi:hypothetical protein